jgi:hypothetical protein
MPSDLRPEGVQKSGENVFQGIPVGFKLHPRVPRQSRWWRKCKSCTKKLIYLSFWRILRGRVVRGAI